ncbi:hypothetical protein ABEB36_014265 [Hypothenemus hampei]|uniref:Retrotransposon gag domain-containing protein n=1 Tax=Hypothenemus hampei TaxID=57062 RepID=A0ABD1E3V6_HYPHA
MSLYNSASNQPIPNISNVKAIAEYLPFFDGNKHQLECFIDRCGKFNNNYGRTTDSSLNDFVHNVICSKLKGNVGNFLMCRPDLTSWPLIKEALREHYGDRIDRQTLTREFLQLNRHRNESIVDFLERLKLMKSQVEVKIQTDESLNDDVLSTNTDDNLRLLLDLKQPNTLTVASDVVIRHFHNEMRINSLSRRQNNNFHTTVKIPTLTVNHNQELTTILSLLIKAQTNNQTSKIYNNNTYTYTKILYTAYLSTT